MKKLIILILFLCSASLVSAQATDENGRPVGIKPSQELIQASQLEKQTLSLAEGSSFNETIMQFDYSLGSKHKNGKAIVFHPKQDKELKTISLLASSGKLSINKSEIGLQEFIVGLYDSEGNFVTEFRVKSN